MVCQLKNSIEDACPEVGDGSGESVTATPSVWETLIGLVLDVPGLGDTMLRFTWEEVGVWVATALASANVQRVKFLVVDSFGNDALPLRETLSSLFASFGSHVRRGTIIMGSKVNLKPNGSKRTELIRQVMHDQQLAELVLWKGPDTWLEHGLAQAFKRIPQAPAQQFSSKSQTSSGLGRPLLEGPSSGPCPHTKRPYPRTGGPLGAAARASSGAS